MGRFLIPRRETNRRYLNLPAPIDTRFFSCIPIRSTSDVMIGPPERNAFAGLSKR